MPHPPPTAPRVDLPPCATCLEEFRDPTGRRRRHPFISCPSCGPGYTVALAAPFQREGTTNGAFEPCDGCKVEFETELNRRHLHEGIACPRCGPSLIFATASGREDRDALAEAAALLHAGGILAVKATGGYHLAVDATNEAAVILLRERKRRPHRPFAVMARDLDWARRCGDIDEQAAALLKSPTRPIVLTPKQPSPLAPSIAPNLGDVGLFLPGTPGQLLLLEAAPPLLVMTSANHSGEATIREDRDALDLLGEVADGVLFHERVIANSADDSVFRSTPRGPIPVRRSRGFVPSPLPIPEGPPLLAVGAQENTTICLAANGEAFLSQHLGDLGSLSSFRRFLEATDALQRFTGIRPEAVAHDLHLDYRSSRWALDTGLPRVAVQHHHAHIASTLVERFGAATPPAAIGVAFDGIGLGSDGQLWGGELLLVESAAFSRLGHLGALPLLGGAKAVREPIRLATAALHQAGEPLDLPGEAHGVAALLDAGASAPLSTGAGRWFDAVASLCGLRDTVSYEGQAAAELEAVAADGPADPYPFTIRRGAGPFSVDLIGSVRAIAADLRAGRGAPLVAARFHETLARIIEAGCREGRRVSGSNLVALGGGCFQNRILLLRATDLLIEAGFEVLFPEQVPPNDGGLSLGQAVIAAAHLSSSHPHHMEA